MAVQVTISSITGSSPYDVYICQSAGTQCFYISTVTQAEINSTYIFDIPIPYDTSSSYMLKLIDNNGCIISGTTSVWVN